MVKIEQMMGVGVTREEGKNQPSPKFLKFGGGVVAKLANAVGKQRVGSRFAFGQRKERVGGKKWNALCPLPIKTRDDGDAPSLHVNELMLGNLNAGLPGQR